MSHIRISYSVGNGVNPLVPFLSRLGSFDPDKHCDCYTGGNDAAQLRRLQRRCWRAPWPCGPAPPELAMVPPWPPGPQLQPQTLTCELTDILKHVRCWCTILEHFISLGTQHLTFFLTAGL
jgi:hypothetical protein